MDRRGSRLSRRQLVVGLTAIGGVLVILLVVGASYVKLQATRHPTGAHRIGLLLPASPDDPSMQTLIGASRQGLQDLGYVEGRNIVIETRFPGRESASLTTLAAELVGLELEIIVAGGPLATRAAGDATGTIPIVAVAGFTHPVAEGFAQSFSHPGGNVTGLATTPPEMVDGKLMELLRDAQPGLTRVAVLWDAGLGPLPETHAAAAQTLGLHLQPIELRDPNDLERAFEVASGGRIDGLVNAESPMLYLHHGRIAALATRYRLPSIALFREYAEAGGLMAYGPNLATLARRAAYYVDRILRGTRPADLPIEQPMTFDFVVNMKTAASLGITFPNEIMLQVTEVVQ